MKSICRQVAVLLFLLLAAASSLRSATAEEQKFAQATPGTPAPVNAPAGRPVTKAELKKLFEDSQWRAFPTGPQTDMGFFTFTKDGKFSTSKNSGGWDHLHLFDVEAPNILKVSEHDPKKDRKTTYRVFRVNFESKTAQTDASLGGVAGIETTIIFVQSLDPKK